VKGDHFDVDGAKTTILTDQLLGDYENERRRIRLEVEIPAKLAELRAAGRPTPQEREFRDREMSSCQTTIKSTVNQARSIFARELLQTAPYRALKLPDLEEFRAKRLAGTTVKSYRRPQAEILASIRDGAAELKQQDPGAWIALQLEANGGLRRGSAADALWEWFVVTGPESVQLQCSRAKGGETDNAFPWDRYQEMRELEQSPTFVLPGKTREERDACCDRLMTWLRGRGLDRRLPNHELRKWAIDRRRTEHGLDEAQNFAGHSDQKLTAKAYSRGRTEKVLRVV
jgi:integrase